MKSGAINGNVQMAKSVKSAYARQLSNKKKSNWNERAKKQTKR